MLTLKELAAHVGVSPSTVSVVLRGESKERKISKKTQDKIWNAVQELGYQPNIAARRLRNQSEEQSLTIALFWVNDFRASMLARFLRALQTAVLQSFQKCEIIICPYRNDQLSTESLLKGLNLFNAAIVCNASQADMAFLENTDFYIPIVLYNRHSQKFCTVNVDDTQMGMLPAKVFSSRGHRKMAVLTSWSAFMGMDIRTKSFLETGTENLMETIAIIEQENSMAGGFKGAQELCALPDRPDCIFCASDAMALGALRAFHNANIRVPEDIEIISVGNGDQEQEEYSFPALSVVRLPMEEMAVSCFDLLLDLVNNQIKPPHSVELPIVYIPRESCGELL